MPATYYWSPRGWVYVPGYWDYPLARRGLVFSPVYFAGPVAVYRPAICLDAGVFSVSLFCRPAYGHYYFGDYYDDRYVAFGIQPYFYYNSGRLGYDPLFGYYRWYHVDHMGERDWDRHLVAGTSTIAAIRRCVRRTPGPRRRLLASREGMGRPDIVQLRMVGDVHVVARLPGVRIRLTVVSPGEQAHIHEAARASVRSAGGTAAGRATRGGGRSRPGKVHLSSMPTYHATHPAGPRPPAPPGPQGIMQVPRPALPVAMLRPDAALQSGEIPRRPKRIRRIRKRRRSRRHRFR